MHEMPGKEYLLHLAEKWMNGTITPEEKSIFVQWYDSFEDELLHVKDIKELDEARLSMLQRLKEKIAAEKGSPAKVKKPAPWYRYAAAAVIFVLLAGGIYFLVRPHGHTGAPEVAADDVAPGTNMAVLKLADGRSVVLDSTGNGQIAVQGGTRVVKSNGGISYDKAGAAAQKVQYNTLSTPLGTHYNIRLQDGTRAWLNAASSITYPTVFTGKERKVAITGEVYFEVARNAAMPFKVKVDQREEVEVLGTHFNINAYADEPAIKTTLLEGLVKVTVAGADKNSVFIRPGQQAQLKDGRINIDPNADTDEAVAWKEGLFEFNGADIETVMRQIARWYNVKVEYRGNVKRHFGGTISRNVVASDVFKMLELTGEVTFKIEGRKVIVYGQ